MKEYITKSIIKVNNKDIIQKEDFIITEYPLNLYVNNELITTFLTTPSNIEYLIYGYLFSEKHIDSITDIIDYNFIQKQNSIYIKLIKKPQIYKKDKVLLSGCGNSSILLTKTEELEAINSEFTIDNNQILNSSKLLNTDSKLFNLTGGIHSCMLYYNEKYIHIEDIGRHNALDKIIGYALKNNIDFTNSYIISSGRISSDMVLKCINAKIPILLSRSAPTSLALSLANKYNLTVIGFIRGKKMNIYTHDKKIKVL